MAIAEGLPLGIIQIVPRVGFLVQSHTSGVVLGEKIDSHINQRHFGGEAFGADSELHDTLQHTSEEREVVIS